MIGIFPFSRIIRNGITASDTNKASRLAYYPAVVLPSDRDVLVNNISQ